MLAKPESRGVLLGYLLVAAVLLGLVQWHAFERLDNVALDLAFSRLRATRPQAVERDVAVIGIDEKTFASLREPFAMWHPHLGKLFKGLAAAKPAAVGLDIVLPDRSYDFLLPRYDQPLLEGLLELGRTTPIVLGQSLDEHGNQRTIFPPYLAIVGADGMGSVIVCRDSDQVIRRIDEAQCGFGAQTMSLPGRMAKRLGIEQDWRGYIDYAIGDAINYTPLHSALEWIERGDTQRLTAAFGGKPVLIGVILPYTDRYTLPVALAGFEPNARTLPGVLVHAQALRSMLNRGLDEPVAAWLLIALAAACTLFWFGGSGRRKLAALIIVAPALPFAGLQLLAVKNVVLPAMTLLAVALLAAAARFVLDAMLDRRERRFLSGTFSNYVSPQIMKEILSGRIRPGLAGRRQRVCIMFCDIRGFTTRAEGMAPESAIELLNEFFDEITAAILKHEGTTNKFLGDGLLALFGAPQPLANAEKNALEAAQEMLQNLARLNARLAQRGIAALDIGIGVHSGDVVLGHVGGATHHEYTAIGDVVNLASRLEHATREFGFPVVCSAPVADAVGRAGNLQDLGEQAVRGHTSVHIFGWRPPALATPPAPTPV